MGMKLIFIAFMEEHRSETFENNVLRGIFGLKIQEVIGG
jgi:hypothetical protein